MNGEPVAIAHKGVTCIFCGTRTPVRLEPALKHAFVPIFHLGLSVIRCDTCGKEAQYQTKEITLLHAQAS